MWYTIVKCYITNTLVVLYSIKHAITFNRIDISHSKTLRLCYFKTYRCIEFLYSQMKAYIHITIVSQLLTIFIRIYFRMYANNLFCANTLKHVLFVCYICPKWLARMQVNAHVTLPYVLTSGYILCVFVETKICVVEQRKGYILLPLDSLRGEDGAI